MITKIATSAMTREEWLAKRRESIGGSDAGAIPGLNKYTSPYAPWAEKTGKVVPEDISDKEAVRLGHDLEDYVAQRFMEATGKKVRRDNHFLLNSDYPFAHALPDRMVIGESAGLECKTTSSWEIVQQCRAGKFPDAWYCQIMHYMMATGAEKWYLAVLCFGHGFYWFEVERNEDEIHALAEAEERFWGYVVNQTPPPVDGTESTAETIKTLYAESDGGTMDLTAVRTALQEYMALGKQVKELQALQNNAAAIVQSFMATAERGVCDGYNVSWKTQTRSTFDKKKFESVRGAIPTEFYKTSTSRPFRVTAV
jgi:putative phage-type endonuclease